MSSPCFNPFHSLSVFCFLHLLRYILGIAEKLSIHFFRFFRKKNKSIRFPGKVCFRHSLAHNVLRAMRMCAFTEKLNYICKKRVDTFQKLVLLYLCGNQAANNPAGAYMSNESMARGIENIFLDNSIDAVVRYDAKGIRVISSMGYTMLEFRNGDSKARFAMNVKEYVRKCQSMRDIFKK